MLTGGPAGAVAGAASGLMSGGGDTTTGTQTSTRSVDLRNMTADERAQHQQSTGGLLNASAGMSTKEIEESRQRNYDALYGRASDEIGQKYETRGAQRTASSARRGAAISSLDRDDARIDRSSEARETGRASQEATIGAEQLLLAERADRRATADAYQRQLDSIWNKRLSNSSVTTTGTSTSTSPDSFWQSAAAGVGNALLNDNSYFNKNGGSVSGLFGGDSGSPDTSLLARPGTTETNSWAGVVK